MKKSNRLFPISGRFVGMLMLASTVAFTACNNDDDDEILPPTGEETIAEIAAGNNDFSVLTQALDEAGLVTTLNGSGPFTVFAPNDPAFNAFLEANDLTAAALLANPDLSDILLYHVLTSQVPAADLENGLAVETAQGDEIYFSLGADNNYYINGVAQITDTDISASNGLIHALDYVLTPPAESLATIATGNDDFSELVAAATIVSEETDTDVLGLLTGADPYTVFAPTNAAFEALYTALGVSGVDEIPVTTLEAVLTYHVLPGRVFSTDLRDGDVATANGATIAIDAANATINEETNIVIANVLARNGVVHAIDQVLLPPMDDSNTIVDIASADENFSILVQALTEAGLVETLQGEGPFTVFAPTNTAFEAYLAANGLTAEELLASENLADILTYHVLPANVASTALENGLEETTVEGSAIYFSLGADDVFSINGVAPISATDIAASNGTIHVIDYVDHSCYSKYR